MTTVEKNGVRHTVEEGPQLDAFLSSGWKVAANAEPAKPAPAPVKRTKK